jgi:hypothetical protein
MTVIDQPAQDETVLLGSERQARAEQVALFAFIAIPLIAVFGAIRCSGGTASAGPT